MNAQPNRANNRVSAYKTKVHKEKPGEQEIVDSKARARIIEPGHTRDSARYVVKYKTSINV